MPITPRRKAIDINELCGPVTNNLSRVLYSTVAPKDPPVMLNQPQI